MILTEWMHINMETKRIKSFTLFTIENVLLKLVNNQSLNSKSRLHCIDIIADHLNMQK